MAGGGVHMTASVVQVLLLDIHLHSAFREIVLINALGALWSLRIADCAATTPPGQLNDARGGFSSIIFLAIGPQRSAGQWGGAAHIIKQRERIKRQTIEHRRLQHRKLAA